MIFGGQSTSVGASLDDYAGSALKWAVSTSTGSDADSVSGSATIRPAITSGSTSSGTCDANVNYVGSCPETGTSTTHWDGEVLGEETIVIVSGGPAGRPVPASKWVPSDLRPLLRGAKDERDLEAILPAVMSLLVGDLDV